MNQQDWEKISSWFEEVVDLSEQEKSARLSRIRQDSPELYPELMKLLVSDEQLHPMLCTDPEIGWQAVDESLLLGTNIKDYQLVELLGSGGMGSVFKAIQITEDFEREIALKLIRPGRKGGLEEFKKERQILAGLNHPSIARLYDSGRTEEGRLFFTMEYVKGEGLIQFLEGNCLNTREIVQLMAGVVEGISYAHSRLVLHLDLKPGNILIDEDRSPKILDFGISELLGGDAAEAQASGKYTAAYAAPEQLSGDSLSTRTDMYALGLLIQEALTSGNEKGNTGNLLPEDLQLIIEACTKTAPEDRYGSAAELKNDLVAWLDDQPISLRKHQSLYQTRKYLRRNTTPLSMIGGFLLILLASAGLFTRNLSIEKQEALTQFQKASELQSFLIEMFVSTDPFNNKGDTATVYDMLSSARQRIDSSFSDQPELFGEMSLTLSRMYLIQDNLEAIDSLVIEAYDRLANWTNPSQSPLRARLAYAQSDLEYYQGRFRQGIKWSEIALSELDHLNEQGALRCETLVQQSYLYQELNDFRKADSFARTATACYEMTDPAPELADLVDVYDLRSFILVMTDEIDSAMFYAKKSYLEKQALYKAPDVELAYSEDNLSNLLFRLGQYEEALEYARSALSQRIEMAGVQHLQTLGSYGTISKTFQEMGLPDSAIIYKLKMLELCEVLFDGSHPHYVDVLNQVGGHYYQVNEWDESIRYLERGIDMHQLLVETGQGQFERRGASIYRTMSLVLSKQGKFREALRYVNKAYEFAQSTGFQSQTQLGLLLASRGDIYLNLDRTEEGITDLTQAQSILKEFPDRFAPTLSKIENALRKE